ncbi:MAG TPA: M14 family zinc carboxypeptidase [Flavobacteriales bacterium]|nr:M14 family zinc carboxypeptidase [Flavobacteriales bacterium]
MRAILTIFLILTAGAENGFSQVYAKTNYTPTYAEIIDFYKSLAKKYKQVKLETVDETDIGKPLHLFSIKGNDSKLKKDKKVRLLINNGIHPGEPDGINASMQFADEILANWKKYQPLFDSVELYIIPVYNVDGCLRRGTSSRANQDGPAEYGFRGNYQNLDLNRDFIKMDSKNAFAFAQIFHKVDPHVIVDTHVSNGADYQYTFTYFFTQPDKLSKTTCDVCCSIDKNFAKKMLDKKIETVPYVNHHEDRPLGGIDAFFDTPRYCTGYAALFNCIGITTETHMLKPFDERVKATYAALWTLLKICQEQREDLLKAKTDYPKNEMAIRHRLDTTKSEKILFKGFEPYYETSNVTGNKQLYYNRNKPATTEIPYYTHYEPTLTVKIPAAYIVPQSWKNVIKRLKANEVPMKELKNDTVITVEFYRAKKAAENSQLYEGHYYHGDVEVETVTGQKKFFKGDFIIACKNKYTRFLVEVLEPMATDSYFRWNYFDACLQQKEWFSDYIFDKKAEEILSKNPDLKQKLEDRKKADPEWAKNSFAQLLFVYQNSNYYEQTAFEIPVYRIF